MATKTVVEKVTPKAAAKKIAPKVKVKSESKPLPINQILINKREAILYKEISFLEKNMEKYRVERKANWKLFKNKMEVDLHKIKQSISELAQLTQ